MEVCRGYTGDNGDDRLEYFRLPDCFMRLGQYPKLQIVLL